MNLPQSQPAGVVYTVSDQHINQFVSSGQNNVSLQEVPVSQPALHQTHVQTQPTYVNAKQYHRILKRREARRRLEEYYAKKRKQSREERGNVGDKRVRDESPDLSRLDANDPVGNRKPYIHESRHKHAMKRPRGPSGRFLTKDELVEYYRQHPEEDPKNFSHD